MIKTPSDIATLFAVQLVEKAIPEQDRKYYRKWLRMYLDFCSKYGFGQSDKNTLPAFIAKLREKNRTKQNQQQATHAVSLYYEIILSGDKKQQAATPDAAHAQKRLSAPGPKLSDPSPTVQEHDAREDTSLERPLGPLESVAADWTTLYKDLESSVKTRNYSPRTYKSYRGWARQLQIFVRSKDPQLLTVTDVKEFLSFLAVKRQVSASSQNHIYFSYASIVSCGFTPKRNPTVPGVIIKSSIEESEFERRGYTIEVAYAYTVNDKKYISNTICCGSTANELSKDIIKKYPVDSDVTVYYREKNPSLSVIEPRFGRRIAL